jgi:hypothetical protein
MHISNFQTSTSGKRVVSRHIKGHALVEKLTSGEYEITHLSKCFNLAKNVFLNPSVAVLLIDVANDVLNKREI